MLQELSPLERETLVRLGQKGPGEEFDTSALNKLFTLGLIDVSSDRRVVLTDLGKKVCRELSIQSSK